jgi:hypothetical protein
MTNYENRLVYLNSAGAQRTFGDADLVGLPVIPTDPVLVDGVIVYGDVFVKPFDYSDMVVPVRNCLYFADCQGDVFVATCLEGRRG